MDGHPRTDLFWGKFDNGQQEGVTPSWHPLVDHMIDVAVCCEALLTHTLTGKRLASLAGVSGLSPGQIARLSVLAGVHDIGKFNNGFQNKPFPDRKPHAGHIGEVMVVLKNGGRQQAQLFEALQLARLAAWCAQPPELLSLLLASISHHGKLVHQGTTGVSASSIWTPQPSGRAPMVGIAQATARLLEAFPAACQEGVPALPANPSVQHAFAGVVMLADWLGSDRELFPFTRPGDPAREVFARRQAHRALWEVGLASPQARAGLRGTALGIHHISRHTTPRAAQREVLSVACSEGGGVTILEAETGAGKTEAALLRFLQLFQAGQVDGMYFALPTRAAARQIHERLTEAVQHCFAAHQVTPPPVLLAVPGYLRVDAAEGRRLPHFRVLWNDADPHWSRLRGWAAEHPKRYLAGAIVVGTIDQVLLSTLKVNHAHLRAASLLRQLLVVDEVHASDAYMTRLLREVLRHHQAAGGHAVLMSATLGVTAQQQLLYPERPPGRGASVSLEEALAVPYPALCHRPFEGDFWRRQIGADNGKQVHHRLETWQDEPARIAHHALTAAAAGAKVLIIRNTVKACLETQHALEAAGRPELLLTCRGRLAPHHARFAAEDRVVLDEGIEEMFSPGRVGGGVAVATQTVQQSLDLDADLMLTDLCPMDVLLQRIGRLHRHPSAQRPGNPRPAGYTRPEVIVLCSREPLGACLKENGEARGQHGVGSVYEDLSILQATLEQLQARDTLSVPDDSRELVERTTHPAVLQALAERHGGAWVRHRVHCRGDTIAKKGIAKRSRVPWEVAVGEREATFDRELDGDVVTRLGERDRLVVFPDALSGAFGTRIRRLRIPAWMAPRTAEALDELVPADVEQTSGGLTFALLGEPYAYTRLGLARVREENAS